MKHPKSTAHQAVEEFEPLASDLSIAVWNRIAQLPQFSNLHPKDFPLVYDSVLAALGCLRANPRGNGRG